MHIYSLVSPVEIGYPCSVESVAGLALGLQRPLASTTTRGILFIYILKFYNTL